MYNNEEKLQFIESIFERIPKDASIDVAQREIIGFLLANTNGGKLYKYRSVNQNSLKNLKEGTLYCAAPSSFNDPFDCQIGFDFHSYISEAFGQELAPVDDYLIKFLKVYDGDQTLNSCADSEKRVFDRWFNSPNLMAFLEQYRGKDIDKTNLGAILLNNFGIVIEILLGFMEDSERKQQMAMSLNIMPNLLKNMTADGILKISDDSASYEDFAHSLGIEDDGDDITLTKLIYQLQRPEDAAKAVKMDEDLAKANKEMGQAIDAKFRVGCLCTDYKNRLMWSHYAEGHKGFCIEYDFSCDSKTLSDLLVLPVVYSKERPKFPWNVALAKDKESDEIKSAGARTMIRSLLTKDEAWNYEDEWRIISLASSGIDNVKMPPISCIYIGALCSQEDRTTLIEIASSLNIPIKQMVVNRGEYKLHAQDVLEI